MQRVTKIHAEGVVQQMLSRDVAAVPELRKLDLPNGESYGDGSYQDCHQEDRQIDPSRDISRVVFLCNLPTATRRNPLR